MITTLGIIIMIKNEFYLYIAFQDTQTLYIFKLKGNSTLEQRKNQQRLNQHIKILLETLCEIKSSSEQVAFERVAEF